MQKLNLLNGYSKFYNQSLHQLAKNHYHGLIQYFKEIGFTQANHFIQRIFIAKTILGSGENSFLSNNVPHGIQLSSNFLILFAPNGILLLNLYQHLLQQHLNCKNIFIPNSQISSAVLQSSSKLSTNIQIVCSSGLLTLKVKLHGFGSNQFSLDSLLAPYQLMQISGNILHLSNNVHYAQSIQHIPEYINQIDKSEDALECYAKPVHLPNHQLALLCLANRDLMICKLKHLNIGYFFADDNILLPSKIKRRFYHVPSQHLYAIQTTERLIIFYDDNNEFNFRDSKPNNLIDDRATNYHSKSNQHIQKFLQHNCRIINKQKFQLLKQQF